jgi:hypothetical protein
MKPKHCDMPVRTTMCATCPFREGSHYAALVPLLTESAITATRICHSTGNNAINRHTGKPEAVCRGARDLQLKIHHATGVIQAPTDEAWNKKRIELGMKPQQNT